MQVLLAWGLQHGTSVIPKTTKVKNLKSNLEVLHFKLPAEDYKALCGITPQVKSLFRHLHFLAAYKIFIAPMTL